MAILKAALGALGVAGTTYLQDTVGKPARLGKLARGYCDRVGKPLLIIRAPRVIDLVLGEPVRAEATTSLAYPLPVPDKAFGAILAINVLEGLEHPDRAMGEWRRCADKVFVVAPSWWSPLTWADPTNRWLISADARSALPLWTGARGRRLLPVSDTGYRTPPWTNGAAPRSHAFPSPPRGPLAPDAGGMVLPPSPPSPPGESVFSQSSLAPAPSQDPQTPPPLPLPPPGSSSKSESSMFLTVVSDDESFSPFDDD
jgi:hypothetical protein